MDRLNGWVGFAAVFLMFTAVWDIIFGLVLLFKDNLVFISTEGLFFLNTTAWGWIVLLTGIVKLFTGSGLLGGAQWARLVAIFLVTVNMIEAFAFVGAAPLWSLIVVIVSAFILYALIVPSEEYA